MTSVFNPYSLIFAICGVITYGTYRLSSKSAPQSKTIEAARTPEFTTFQNTWLGVYLLAMFSDWLQGPYAYALYSSLGFTSSQIAILSLIGFASSMLFGTFAGSISDSFGRKKMSLLFVVLYSSSALTKLSSNFAILAVGRVFSGIATSLLFSVFESWMICAHNQKKFAPELISDTFSKATAGNGLCAVFAGLVADQMSAQWGFASPFIFSCIPLFLLGGIIHFYWDENTGADSSDGDGTKSGSKLNQIITIFKTNPHVLALGFAQSLFEGAMYTFVFLWGQTLSAVTSFDDGKLPYGNIFATFMVIVSFGSYVFGYLVKNYNVLIIPFIIHSVAGLSMVLAGLFSDSNEYIVLFFFLLFEMTCGMFWPTYGTLRSSQIPEAQRATVASVFRIPLNLFVIALLSQTEKMTTTTMLIICAAAHFASLFFYSIFYFKASQQQAEKKNE